MGADAPIIFLALHSSVRCYQSRSFLLNSSMPPKRTPKGTEVAKEAEEGHEDQNHGPHEEDQDNEYYPEVLTFGATRIDREEAPEWDKTLFGEHQSIWDFPLASKDGHLADLYDPIAQRLQAQATTTTGAIQASYQAYTAEWKTLRQSLLYSRLIGAALHQIASLAEEQGEAALASTIQHLETIAANLASDQLERASVLITAADHSSIGADKLAF